MYPDTGEVQANPGARAKGLLLAMSGALRYRPCMNASLCAAGRLASSHALLALLCLMGGSGCEEGLTRGAGQVEVPADHPCPEAALADMDASLFEAERATGAPVPLALVIPFEAELEALVTQGNAQGPTHSDGLAFAWDFAVDEGTSVVSSAPGVVVWVRDDSVEHGRGAESLDDANWIVVDHGGGLFSSYVHLEAASALVEAGDVVKGGEALARTGLSGQLTGAHLHFQVENTWSRSVPAAFVAPSDERECAWVPELGELARQAPGVASVLVWSGRASEVPADAFQRYGVSAIFGLNARLMARSESYQVIGEVEGGASSVWLLMLPEEGGDAVAWLEMPVHEGRFDGRWELSHLQAGRYGWAAVAVSEGETPRVSETVRVSLTD